ncbi:hypothetical protein [Bordetella petrii]|uniref:hypothetical protein n=1 Tax=Bordetella petrii TaxID=94624 RepID=UPI001E4496E6|nr:hypothetical protein [Bordetella petrii]MCD0505277.1 hypothetical protein [Bordetella petrii]
MAVRFFSYVFVAGAASLAAPALAGVCDARFMHDGGAVQLTGSGNLSLGADLAFAEVAKTNSKNCRARVQGTASFSYAGLPAGKSKLDYLMTIKDGQASFVRYAKAGEKPEDTGQFDLRMLGLFAYDGKVAPGQTMPGATYRLNIGKDAPVGGQPTTVVRIGQKTVGDQQPLDTALGRQACWPIRYTRNTDPTLATFQGITLPIPGMNTTVTDWYCPAVNLVMRQDIDQNGVKSAVEITQIK